MKVAATIYDALLSLGVAYMSVSIPFWTRGASVLCLLGLLAAMVCTHRPSFWLKFLVAEWCLMVGVVAIVVLRSLPECLSGLAWMKGAVPSLAILLGAILSAAAAFREELGQVAGSVRQQLEGMTTQQRTKLAQGLIFGVFFQYLGYSIKDMAEKNSPPYVGGTIGIVMGFIIFAWGCAQVVTAKKLPRWATAFGLLSFVGLAVLFWWPPASHKLATSQAQ